MPGGRAVEIGVLGDDARVLAAHLGDAGPRIRARGHLLHGCCGRPATEPVNVTPAVRAIAHHRLADRGAAA